MRMRLLLLLVIVQLFAINSFAECTKENNLVTRVIDGDTIEVDGSTRIRILGIDTYDTNKRYANKQAKRTGLNLETIKFLSEKATLSAKNMLLGQCVRLEKDYLDEDRFGRKLRYVFIGGRDYQKIMLSKDLANVYCGDKKIKKFNYYLSMSKFKC